MSYKQKSGIRDIIAHTFATIGIDSYNSLSIEKNLTFHNVIILFKFMGIKITTTLIYF